MSLFEASSSHRESFDVAFQALETLIASNGTQETTPSDQDILAMVQLIDFTKLGQEALERASGNKCIPQEIVMKAALTVCRELRSQRSQQMQLGPDDWISKIRGRWNHAADRERCLDVEASRVSDCDNTLQVCIRGPSNRATLSISSSQLSKVSVPKISVLPLPNGNRDATQTTPFLLYDIERNQLLTTNSGSTALYRWNKCE